MRDRRYYISIGELISTTLLILYATIALIMRNQFPELMHCLGIIIFFYAIYTWKKKTGDRWFNPYTIFQLFFTLFNYGQPIMWAFGIHQEGEIGSGVLYYGSGFYPTAVDIMNAQVYTCSAMLIFHFGAILLAHKNSQKEYTKSSYKISPNYSLIKKTMKTVSLFLLVVITPIALLSKVHEVVIARSFGYSALYYGDYSTQNGYISVLMYFFFPALVGYLIANDYSKSSRRIIYTIFGLYALLGVLSGDRGSWLYSLIILIWFHTYYKKIPIRKYILITILGILGIYILSAITNVRNTGLEVSGEDILATFKAENSPITDAFFEMGGSMGIITFFLNRGNDIFPYANTYLTAILGVVSSRVLNLFGLNQILIADWFSQEYLGISWGTGFSMIGEAYVNGGYVGGLIYMFIIGALFGKLLDKINKNNRNTSPLNIFISVASLNVIIGFARGALYLTLKELFYGVFITYLIIRLLSNKKERI